MMNFLHNYSPDPVMLHIFFLPVRWYGFFIALGIALSILMIYFLNRKLKIKESELLDFAFYLIIWGVIGARAYHILLEYQYYLENPLQIIQIWKGGLAIHGAIIAGIAVSWFFAGKKIFREGSLYVNMDRGDRFFFLMALISPALALGQAIGRWGNYFNQELFGNPTYLPWGIPIDGLHRPLEHLSREFFHPTFLYESMGSLVIFLLVIWLHFYFIKHKKHKYEIIVAFYLISYSLLRFGLEFIRIDRTPDILGLRWPQIISLVIIIVALNLTRIKKMIQSRSVNS